MSETLGNANIKMVGLCVKPHNDFNDLFLDYRASTCSCQTSCSLITVI